MVEVVETATNLGLIDLIAEATSESEVKALVNKGKSEYTSASPKTVRRWERVAVRRVSELNAPDVPVTAPTSKTEKKKGKKL